MKRFVALTLVFLVAFVFAFSPAEVIAAEKLKGKVMRIVPEEKMVIIKDKSGQKWTIYFEKERVFKRFKRLKIRKGDKVLIKYEKRGNRLIGTYVRSLEGC